MPRTDAACRNAKAPVKPRKISDSGDLYLYVKPNGSRLWQMAYRWQRRQPAALEVKQQLAPALRALSVAVGKAQNLLVTPFIRADQHQNALFVGNLIPRIKF